MGISFIDIGTKCEHATNRQLSAKYQLVGKEESADEVRYTCAVCDNVFESLLEVKNHFNLQHTDNGCTAAGQLEYADEEADVVYNENEINAAQTEDELSSTPISANVSVLVGEGGETEVVMTQKELKISAHNANCSSSVRIPEKRKQRDLTPTNERSGPSFDPDFTNVNDDRILQTHGNRSHDDNTSLAALNKMPSVKEWLKSAISQDSPLAMYELICSTKIAPETLHNQFWRTIQLTLFDYYGMVGMNQNAFYHHKHENTFYVERIVPMFKYLSKMTGLLTFQWYESKINSSAISYIDGVGKNAHGELLVIEVSSGTAQDYVAHTNKYSRMLMELADNIIKAETMEYLDASLQTFCRRKVIWIQTIMNRMTLSTVSLYNDASSNHKVDKLQSVNVPITWEERYYWLRVFELLAQVKDILVEQQEVLTGLEKEKTGFIKVGTEETVRFGMK